MWVFSAVVYLGLISCSVLSLTGKGHPLGVGGGGACLLEFHVRINTEEGLDFLLVSVGVGQGGGWGKTYSKCLRGGLYSRVLAHTLALLFFSRQLFVCLFSFLVFLTNFRCREKLQKQYREFPYIPYPASPNVNVLYTVQFPAT